MAAEHLFKAMQSYRQAHRSTPLEGESSQLLPFSGKSVARSFAESASKSLSKEKLTELQHFFTDASFCRPGKIDTEELSQELDSRLATFFDQESQLSGEDKSRLLVPSGPADAELGLMFHVKTRETCHSRNIWDLECRTVQSLAGKGVSEEFTFGFGWHRRAEKSCVRRGNCPMTQYPINVRDLHDQLSFDVLKKLPMPFLIVCGNCAMKGHRRTLSREHLSVEVPTGLGEKHLPFELEFDGSGLKRITCYAVHPGCIGFRPHGSSYFSISLDATFNFLLWIIGQPHNENFFEQYRQGRLFPKKSMAMEDFSPFPQLWKYRRIERARGVVLERSHFDDRFWNLAQRALSESLEELIQAKKSVPDAMVDHIAHKAYNTLIRHETGLHGVKGDFNTWQDLRMAELAGRAANKRISNKITVGCLHGKYIVPDSNGIVRFFVDQYQQPLRIRATKEAYLLSKSGKQVTIHFEEEGIVFRSNDRIIHRVPNQNLPPEWTHLLQKERAAQPRDALRRISTDKMVSACNSRALAVKPTHLSAYRSALRLRLLQGELYRSPKGDEKCITKTIRQVSFFDAKFNWPKDCEVGSLHILCDLVNERQVHDERCAQDTYPDDPACTLGVRFSWIDSKDQSRHVEWRKLQGDYNTMKLNTIVDFLWGRPLEYTKAHLRRFVQKGEYTNNPYELLCSIGRRPLSDKERTQRNKRKSSFDDSIRGKANKIKRNERVLAVEGEHEA